MNDTAIASGSMPSGHCVADTHVPRTLVHKAADGEVLLADAEPLAENRFAVTVRWPHDHLLHHRDTDGSRDSLVVVETLRQAGIYLSHRFYGVPMDHAFVLHDVEFHLDGPLRDGSPEAAGADVVFDITVHRDGRNPRRFRMSSEAAVLVGGRPLGRAAMRWDALTPRQYDAIRYRNAPAVHADRTDRAHGAAGREEGIPLPAPAVGRHRSDAVLLASVPGDRPGSWRLRMDTGHRALFDHASDHVPGMVLVEAFRQAALVNAGGSAASDAAPRMWSLDSMRTTFEAFGELGLPVTITAAATGPDDRALLVTARQTGRVLATARLTGASLPLLGRPRRKAGAAC